MSSGRRTTAAACGFVVGALALFGCGAGDDGGDRGAATAASAAAPASADPGAKPVDPSRPPAAQTPPPAAPRRTSLTVAVSGDLLIHSPLWRRALADGGGRRYDFSPMFRVIRPYVRGADLAICHVETPMGPGPPKGYPVFNTPTGLARAVRHTGWDACDTASNHSLDQGQAGVDGTVAALRRAGVGQTGSFRSAKGRRRILILRAKGVKVALLAYTEMTNGIPLPNPWSVNLARANRILADARRARRAGADAVLVNLHWGIENQHSPSAFQRRLARRLVRSRDITAVVGQHVHVVQPIRRVGGKLVVYGEGNLVSNQSAACCPAASQDGIIAVLTLRVRGAKVTASRIRYVPTWVRLSDYTVLPVGDALRRGLAPAAALRASYRRTVSVVGRSKRVTPGPSRLP